MLTLLLLSTAHAAPGWTTIMPFGVGAYTHGKPGRGIVYTLTQTAGIALSVTATLVGDQMVRDEKVEEAELYRYLTAAGSSFAGAAYFVSVLDASRLHQLEAESQSRLITYPQPRLPFGITQKAKLTSVQSRYFLEGLPETY